MMEPRPQQVIVELCRRFYELGWATGTGGGISIRQEGRVYMAPSGVQKERIAVEDIYELDLNQNVVTGPAGAGLKPSECAPLFYNAFRMRDAGACLHSHGVYAILATLTDADVFECTELEMIKGIVGHGFYDRLQVPIIDNTAHECDLAESMAEAMSRFPQTQAVLVRRHGVYVWGPTWQKAKTQAECYHYLFEAAVRMRALGVDPAASTGRRGERLGGHS